jgi:hypothetical protein
MACPASWIRRRTGQGRQGPAWRFFSTRAISLDALTPRASQRRKSMARVGGSPVVLQEADAGAAHAGPEGQLLLRQPGRLAGRPQLLPHQARDSSPQAAHRLPPQRHFLVDRCPALDASLARQGRAGWSVGRVCLLKHRRASPWRQTACPRYPLLPDRLSGGQEPATAGLLDTRSRMAKWERGATAPRNGARGPPVAPQEPSSSAACCDPEPRYSPATT